MELKVQFLPSLALAFALVSGAAFAQESGKSGKTLTPQQQRMVACNKEATGKTGDERKTFMSSCLKGDTSATAQTAPTAQQEKMTSCNAEAKTRALAGDERKNFMSTCLKGDDVAVTTPDADAETATASTAKSTQKEKKKTCSADAKAQGLKGDPRKAYVKACMSADGVAH